MWPYKHNPDYPQAILQILHSVVDTLYASCLQNFFPFSAPVQCLSRSHSPKDFQLYSAR